MKVAGVFVVAYGKFQVSGISGKVMGQVTSKMPEDL